ncbi:MAG: hypothetical protein R3B84_04530 [Zavarzinella sp.]
MKIFSFFVGLLFVTTFGCGESAPKLVSVTGKVVFNNQPVTAGSIFLHPEAANTYQKDKPSSLLQLDGGFKFKTFPFGDGVPPGKYRVVLAPEVANRLKKPDYANPEKTPWQLNVPESGVQNIILEVQ